MSDTLNLVISGVTGRMGKVVARLAHLENTMKLVGGIASKNNPLLKRTFREAWIADSDALIYDIDSAHEALSRADVVISFTTPAAEIENISTIRKSGTKMVVGTTGFSAEQLTQFENEISKIPSVFSPNFSVGATVLQHISKTLAKNLSAFDFSLIEMHHKRKIDSPSGTALAIASEITRFKGYSKVIHGRTGKSVRTPEELEIFSVRGGGIPGVHTVLASGDYELLKLEHDVFSREAFAYGSLLAARWIIDKPAGLYRMSDVLGLN
jgi:4-hydroxy-tetrahydrodipicolinate reductase